MNRILCRIVLHVILVLADFDRPAMGIERLRLVGHATTAVHRVSLDVMLFKSFVFVDLPLGDCCRNALWQFD